MLLNLLGAFILAFGMYNIHSISQITEGGVLGLQLLLEHFFDISPSVSGLLLTLICYAVGFKTFGRSFVVYSAVACLSYSAFYALNERLPRLYPEISQMPLAAALVGAVFVGTGCGLCVRFGGAPSGDDALAMSLSRVFNCGIARVYLISDLTVLLLSLSYIPAQRLVYSLVTVVLSGQIIGFIERAGTKRAGNAS